MRLDLDRSTVRTWREDDAASLARHANDRDVWINVRDAFPHPYTLADAERYIGMSRAQNPPRSFAIEVDGEASGAIAFKPGTDVERISAEVGYWIGRPFWGRGIVTEALAATRDRFAAERGLLRVFAVPYAWNVASHRVLEKAGFALEGRLRNAALKDGKVVDQLLYAWVPPPGSATRRND